jgi:hypothetical protein
MRAESIRGNLPDTTVLFITQKGMLFGSFKGNRKM